MSVGSCWKDEERERGEPWFNDFAAVVGVAEEREKTAAMGKMTDHPRP